MRLIKTSSIWDTNPNPYEFLINTIVSFDTDYHNIRANRDDGGTWSMFVDDTLVGTAFDNEFNQFGSVTVGFNNRGGYITDLTINADPIPEPTTMLLLGTGLLGLAGVRRRKK